MYAATLCCALVLLTAFSVGMGQEKIPRIITERVSNQTTSEVTDNVSVNGTSTEQDSGEEAKDESSTNTYLKPRAVEEATTVSTPQGKKEKGKEATTPSEERKKKKQIDPFSIKVFLGENNGIRVEDNTLPIVRTFLNFTGLNAYSVDYHYRNKTVFYTGLNRIFRDDVVGRLTRTSGPSLVIENGVDGPVRLAVDWIHDRIYWIADKYQTVESSNIDGSNRTLLFDSFNNTIFPNNIAVDPYKGYLFFVSNATIFRSSLDGSSLTQLELPGDINRGVRCLALDIRKQRIIYFGKAGDYTNGKPFLASCGYNGDHAKDFTFSHRWNDIYSMDVFRDKLYFAHYKEGSPDNLWSTDLTKDPLVPVRMSSSQGLWCVKVYHPEAQTEPKEWEEVLK